jgi:uncharacterized membrane protein
MEATASVSYLPEDKRIMVAVAYFFGWLGGIILLLIAKDDRALRFHAVQAILLSVLMGVLVLTICGWIFVIVYIYYGIAMVLMKGDFRTFFADLIDRNA